jgi:lipopolysaccharide transport system ATP-binding protein
LVVDEVLAVGDAEFQKKCIGKMGDISKGEGRTILFVSHNMVSVRNLCKNAVFLENGMIKSQGKVLPIVDEYINSNKKRIKSSFQDRELKNSRVYIRSFKILSEIITGAGFMFEAEVYSEIDLSLELAFTLRTFDNQPLFQIYSGHCGVNFNINKGMNTIRATIDSLPLIHGDYLGNVWLGSNGVEYDFVPGEIKITVREGSIRKNGPVSSNNGYPIIYDANWLQLK